MITSDTTGFPDELETQFHSDGTGVPPKPADTPTEIIVDDRERSSGVVEHLLCLPQLRVTIRRLELGDYLVDNRILIERKTVSDFAISIVDGRLFTQACRMIERRFVPALILEGAASGEEVPGVTREAMQGALISLTLFLGIPCLRSVNSEETARLLRFVADQMQRQNTRGICRHGYRPKGQRKRQLFILQGLPGIGPARAERLLAIFGSVEAIFKASADDLASVAGIGDATATAIRNLIAPVECTGPSAGRLQD